MSNQAMFGNCVANKYYGHEHEVHWKDVAIAQAVIASCIKEGYLLRLYDGEEWATEKTKDGSLIERELFATGEEVLYVYSQLGKQIGFVFFVWGNTGWDVINDNSTVLESLGLMKDAQTLSERFENDDIPVYHVSEFVNEAADVNGFAVYAGKRKVTVGVLSYEKARELCRSLNFGEIVLLSGECVIDASRLAHLAGETPITE